MTDIAYQPTFGLPISFVFTPSTGTAFGSTVAQAEELTPADLKIDTAKMTPISGPNAGNEQFALGKIPVATVAIKATYLAAEHAAAQICLAAKVKGTLVVTYGDGATDTYANSALTGIKQSAVTASNLRTDDLEFTVPLPSVFATA